MLFIRLRTIILRILPLFGAGDWSFVSIQQTKVKNSESRTLNLTI